MPQIDFDTEQLAKIQGWLNAMYDDGIDAFESAYVDDNDDIVGIAQDISGNDKKRLVFKISPSKGTKSINSAPTGANFSEFDVSALPWDLSDWDGLSFSEPLEFKDWSCTKGKPCKGRCISQAKTCRDSLSPDEQKAVKKIKQGKQPEAKTEKVEKVTPDGDGIDRNAYDKSKSTFNAIGSEREYAGVSRDPGNSRIFGIREELRDWEQLDADTQAGYWGDLIGQLRGRNGNSDFDRRANGDAMQLWDKTSDEAKKKVLEQNGDVKASSPALKEILSGSTESGDSGKANKKPTINSVSDQAEVLKLFDEQWKSSATKLSSKVSEEILVQRYAKYSQIDTGKLKEKFPPDKKVFFKIIDDDGLEQKVELKIKDAIKLIEKQRDKDKSALDKRKTTSKTEFAEGVNLEKASSAKFVTKEILAAIKAGDLTEAILDNDGNLASVFTYKLQKERITQPGSLYIDFLASSPNNFIKGGKKIKGGGTQAIKRAIEKSIESGFGGRVTLTALDDAAPFYERIGFKKGKYGEYMLDPDIARKFLYGN